MNQLKRDCDLLDPFQIVRAELAAEKHEDGPYPLSARFEQVQRSVAQQRMIDVDTSFQLFFDNVDIFFLI